jgi:hypothetical protein
MLRRIILAVLLTVLASPVFARTFYWNYAQQGGQSVLSGGFTSTTKVQKSYPGATVTVYEVGTLTKATLYSNITGTILANPVTADSTGRFSFYTDETEVDITFSGSGVASPFTWSKVSILAGAGSTAGCADPVDFGAILDDGLDDYAAFVAARLASQHICLSDGTYSLASTWTPGFNTRITGQGIGVSVIEWIGATSGLMMYAPGGNGGYIDGITVDGNSVAGVNGILGDGAVTGAKPYGARWGSYSIANTPGVAMEMRMTTADSAYYTFWGHPYILNVGTGIKFITTDGSPASNNSHHFGNTRVGTCTLGVDLDYADGISFDSLTIEGCTTGVDAANSSGLIAQAGWTEGNTTDVLIGAGTGRVAFWGNADASNVYTIPFSNNRSALSPMPSGNHWWLRGRWFADNIEWSGESGTTGQLRAFQLGQVGLVQTVASDGATTVDVTNVSKVLFSNTSITSVTNLTTTRSSHIQGHRVTLMAVSATNVHVAPGTNFALSGGDWVGAVAGDNLTVEWDVSVGKWVEVSRSAPRTTVIDKSGTQVATGANTTETDLWSDTLPLNLLAGSLRTARFTFSGTLGANTNAKTLRLYIPTTTNIATCAFAPSGATTTAWRMIVEVTRTGNFSQDVSYQCLGNAHLPIVGFGAGSATVASALAWKLTGQNGTAIASDIVFEQGTVELLP